MTGVHLDPRRTYRLDLAARAGEVRFGVVVGETDLLITAGRDLSSEALAAVNRIRGELKAYAALDPGFVKSYSPVSVPETAPGIVREMAFAAALCGVGPMAAVAGAVSESTARALVEASPDVLVENGGDCFLYSTRERVVGLLVDPKSGVKLGIKLLAGDFPTSICSSSARIGPSASLGVGEIIAVRAKSGALADAAATYLGNRLKSGRDLEYALDASRELEPAGLEGVFIGVGGRVGVRGAVELVAL